MVNEVQDHYFRMAKKDGYPARSVYKLEEADQKYKILQKADKVLDLGCQPGSWSLYCARKLGPAGLVVGIDLNQGKKISQTGKAKMVRLCGDIMEEETHELLREMAPLYDVVLSDMAPRTTGNKWADQQQSLELSRMALALAEQFLKPGGHFYCKVFEGEDYKEYFRAVQKRFEFTKTVKPKSSRKESREVFVLGLKFKGK